MSKPKCILILGMRSGTSMLAGCLHKCGVFMGHSLDGSRRGNAKGQFENKRVMALNNRILKTLGTGWNNLNLKEKLDLPLMMDHKTVLTDFLRKEYKNRPIFGIKEPRTSLLLPLYMEALKWTDVRIVIPMRNRGHIANSLCKRDGTKFDRAMSLVNIWYDTIEKYVEGFNPHRIDFNFMMSNPIQAVQGIDSSININESAIMEFVDTKLVNF